jgi:hypothetical protein
MADEFQTRRSGDEPMHARSPLGLRLWIAGFGLVAAVAGIIVFALEDVPALVAVFAAFAALTVVDAAIVVRHIRAGDDYQPAPAQPPYRLPDVDHAPPPPLHPPTVHRRHTLFIWTAAASLVLLINAWAWIEHFSVAWATILSIIAGLLLLFGVLTANTGSALLDGNTVPGTAEEDREQALLQHVQELHRREQELLRGGRRG